MQLQEITGNCFLHLKSARWFILRSTMKKFLWLPKLTVKKTYWLPFNKGHNKGKGNPPNPNGYKTDYLWNEILVKDSWLDIIQRLSTYKLKK